MKTENDEKTTEERIKAVIRDEIGVEMDKVVNDANFIYDLGADELDFIEMIMAIEEEFGICITDEDADRLKTVGELVEFVNGKLK